MIGEQLNTFLRQIGYIRNRDYMLMEDLTEEEHDALLDYLQDLRDGNVNISVTTSTHTTCTTSGYIQSVDEDGGEEND